MTTDQEAAWFNKAVLMRPRRLHAASAAWNGHIPFAAWLIAVLKPSVLVELGTHAGVSFSAFCQAVAATGAPTRCFAVDTWQGDAHTGSYDEDIFASVSEHVGRHYAQFATLLQMTFDEALSHFQDGTVDLLHIDGLHTYEAVRHDYETWLPKMSERGVILFHDTVVRREDFGVWRLWEELRDQYPSIEFVHAHGLGVLFLGKDLPREVISLVDEGTQGNTAGVKRFFERLGAEIPSAPRSAARDLLESRVVGAIRPHLGRVRMAARSVPAIMQLGGGPLSAARKAVKVLRTEGWPGVTHRMLLGYMMSRQGSYQEWIEKYDTIDDAMRERLRARAGRLPEGPRLSIVMPVYNPRIEHLREAIRSVQNQIYPHWQLCIADDASTDSRVRVVLEEAARQDARIRIEIRARNGHISEASNSALALVDGDFTVLMDHDDLLPEHALLLVAEAVVATPDVQIVYSDEDKIEESGARKEPYFKPDFNPELFTSHNMISHLGAYRTCLVREIGGFRKGFEGSQDYDLALRCIERSKPHQIVHIPRILYHWRVHPESTSSTEAAKPYALLAGERALNEHFARTGVTARAELREDRNGYRVKFEIPAPAPLVSIVIPTRNARALVQQCIDSILAKSTYRTFEILLVDNGSDEPESLSYFESLGRTDNVRVIRDDGPFNYSRLNNGAARQAKGYLLCLLNNDIEVITPSWLEEMVGLAVRPEIGCVGARLLYPDGTLQHGGVVLGLKGPAAHAHKHLPRVHGGRNGRAILLQNFSAVTAACLMLRKTVYDEVHGLDEGVLSIGFGDVDLCLKVRQAGYRNVWTPYAELYHHESATRGADDNPEKKARHAREVREMRTRWREIIDRDPAYSPNLTLDREDFSLAWPPRVDPL